MFLHASADNSDPLMDESEIDSAIEELEHVPQTGRRGPYWNVIRTTLLRCSTSNDVDEAIKEWKFTRSWMNESACELCGHFPIHFHFQIVNRLNGNSLVVGSECILNYLDIPGVPSKEALRKRLNQMKSKARAIALGQAGEGDMAKLQEVQELERALNLMIKKVAAPDTDIDIFDFYVALQEPIRVGRVINVRSTSFREVDKAFQDAMQFRVFLEKIGKRSTKYKPFKLLPAVSSIMNLRSGLDDQKTLLSDLQRHISKTFNVADAHGLVQMAWEEIRNGRGDILNKLNEKVGRAKAECQASFSGILDFVKPYEHLRFLIQTGIDANKAQMDKLAAESRELLESERFSEAVTAAGQSPMSRILPTFVSTLTTGDSYAEDAAFNVVKFVSYIRDNICPRNVVQAVEDHWHIRPTDMTGMRKAILRAADDSIVYPEDRGTQALAEVITEIQRGNDAIEALFQEEVDDIKEALRGSSGQKVYQAFSDAWGFDCKKLFQALPQHPSWLLAVCSDMLDQFLRGRMSPDFKQRSFIEKQSSIYRTPVGYEGSCWDKLEGKLRKVIS